MKRKNLLTASIMITIFLSLSVSTYAIDPGIPDTVYIGGGPLSINRSRMITLSITNDENIGGFGLGFLFQSLDGGFARFDSVRWIGRTADPSVFGFRISKYCNCEATPGVSPDIFVIGADKYGLNDLPPGRGGVAEIYLTGLTEGSFSIDSVFFPPAGPFILINSNPIADLHPQFAGSTVQVIAGNPLPTIATPESSFVSSVGHSVSFSVIGTSAIGGAISLTLESIANYDNDSRTPAQMPSVSGGNPINFSWTPTSSDVGIWLASFDACDSSGSCVTGVAEIQVVEEAKYIVKFDQSMISGSAHSTGIAIGDADTDGNPEILISGNGSLGSPSDDFCQVAAGPILERISAASFGFINYGVKSAFLDSDDNIDFVMMRSAGGGVYHCRALLSNGDDTYSEVFESNDGHATRSCAITELTGDAHLDLASSWLDGVRIYAGNSQGGFTYSSILPSSETATSLNTGDFNNDGYQDLAVGTSSGLKIYLKDTFGIYQLSSSYSQTNGSLDIEVTNQGSDLNDDGLIDLCISTPSIGGQRSQMVVYYGISDGTFGQETVRDVKGQIFGNSVGDFNNDGQLDLVFVNGARNYVALAFGDTQNPFANEIRFSTGSHHPRHVAAFDADSDGDLDLIITAYKSMGAQNDNIVMFFENRLDPPGFEKVALSIDTYNNARVEFDSPSGFKVNAIRNTAASASFSERNADADSRLDSYTQFCTVETGKYTVKARPRPEALNGETFSIEFNLNGQLHRLAKDVVMTPQGFDFGVSFASNNPIVPRPGTFSMANPPSLMWPGQGQFNIQIANDPSFSSLIVNTTVQGNSYQAIQSIPLQDTTTVYWRVKPIGAPNYDCIYTLNLMAATVGCGDVDGNQIVTVSDIVFLINYIFAGGQAPNPLTSADADCSGIVNISDAVFLINYVFGGGASPCSGC